MGLSKRAKRGISVFNQINQKSFSRWRYSAKRLTVNRPGLAANIADAAIKAMDALPEEMKNAYIPELSIKEDNAKPEEQEGGAEHGVSGQPEGGPEAEKGTPGGPQ